MPSPHLLAIAAVISAASGLVVSVPQMSKVVRTGSTTGVSLAGWVAWCLSFAGWLVYLAGTGQRWLFLGLAAEAVVCLATTVVIARRSSSVTGSEWVSTGVWGSVLLIATAANWAGHGAAISVLLASSPLWFYGPAVTKAWRSADVSGVSAGTWALAVVNGLAFALAGAQNLVTVANGCASVLLAVAVLARLQVAGPTTTRINGKQRQLTTNDA